MLRPIDPSESPAPLAYRVPWYVDRSDETHPLVVNGGSEPVDFVRVFCDDMLPGDHDLHGRVDPGHFFEVCLCGADLDAVIVTLCWFRPDGDEYVWRFVV